ncbi:hypothetical protein [Microvirga flavescens]|uniref:hypothetical protein n=1 Tax=Microvirga flavescens TaxID=2249811 RepID=UPI000DDB1B6E|nr:hypothetical protein [Microvirga flavescens]
MLLTALEGLHWRYEVCAHEDGYLVQMRDLETGDLDAEFSTIFRTMPVAFAFAEMSAAYERFAADDDEAAKDQQAQTEVATSEQHFIDLSSSLHDSGINGIVVENWRREKKRRSSRTLH